MFYSPWVVSRAGPYGLARIILYCLASPPSSITLRPSCDSVCLGAAPCCSVSIAMASRFRMNADSLVSSGSAYARTPRQSL